MSRPLVKDGARRAAVVACMTALTMGATGQAHAAAAPATSEEAIVVRLAPDAVYPKVAKRARIAVDRRLSLPDTLRVRPTRGQSIDDALQALRTDDAVVWAQADHQAQLAQLPTEGALKSRLWGMTKVDAQAAWMQSLGDPGVTVAVVDTGIDYTHKDLIGGGWTNPGESDGGREANGIDDDANGYVDDWRGWDFQSNDADPSDAGDHGTHVAGIIGAQSNRSGVVGLAPHGKVMSVKACDVSACWESDMASAFYYAAMMGAKVVNVSIITPLRNLAMLDAINAAPQTLFVAAAGNNALDLDLPQNHAYPCEFSRETPNVMCVAASNDGDYLASWSNRGSSVDVAAPGVKIYSTAPRDRYQNMSGTSMAAPHVAGAAALRLAVHPGSSPAESRGALAAGDPMGWSTILRLNAGRGISQPGS